MIRAFIAIDIFSFLQRYKYYDENKKIRILFSFPWTLTTNLFKKINFHSMMHGILKKKKEAAPNGTTSFLNNLSRPKIALQ